MKFLKFAIFFLCICFPFALSASNDVTFDLERISTENGKVYRDILILDSDRHGLLFRHSKGIAKIDFSRLSMNLRMLYEPVGEEPTTMPEASLEGDPIDPEILDGLPPVTLTARTSATIPIRSDYFGCWSPCEAYRRSYPGWWPRYQPALRLAVPRCRSLAVKDFLITTGLVPRPFGVKIFRLPYNRADLLY